MVCILLQIMFSFKVLLLHLVLVKNFKISVFAINFLSLRKNNLSIPETMMWSTKEKLHFISLILKFAPIVPIVVFQKLFKAYMFYLIK